MGDVKSECPPPGTLYPEQSPGTDALVLPLVTESEAQETLLTHRSRVYKSTYS